MGSPQYSGASRNRLCLGTRARVARLPRTSTSGRGSWNRIWAARRRHQCSGILLPTLSQRLRLSMLTKKLARSAFRYIAGRDQFCVTLRTLDSKRWAAYKVPRPGMQAQESAINPARKRGAILL
ncbi:hypothetical protein D3C71_1324050 [compost metagenome]